MRNVYWLFILGGCGEFNREQVAGPPGRDGTSANCNVERVLGGAFVRCSDGSEAFVEDGSDGEKGETGPEGEQGPAGDTGAPGPTGQAGTSLTIQSIIPCPALVGSFPEVLFCINDTLYAVYDGSGKQDVHLTQIIPGSYVTTDGRSCHFTVSTGCEIQ